MALYMVNVTSTISRSSRSTFTRGARLRLYPAQGAGQTHQLRRQRRRTRRWRAFDLFGADREELVQEVHSTAGVQYLRIVKIFDVTPIFIRPRTSRPRRFPSWAAAGGADSAGKAKGVTHAMTVNPELTRWLSEGQRLFGVCLEMLESFERLQTENDMLREETARLRHRVDLLQTDRAEMVAAFNDLAGHVTQVVDHIIQKSEDGEGRTPNGT